jgi:very-short-patch-repair endonuclease
MRSKVPLSREVVALAGRQHGVVARRQLLPIGLSPSAIVRLRDAGWLQDVHRGVYAVGHRVLSRHGRWLAAVLGAGPGAKLSHRGGGALWRVAASDALEVTVPVKGRKVAGIIVHAAELPPDEVTTCEGIPVTTVARTLLDLATVLPRHRLERAVHQADHRRLTDRVPLSTLLERYRGRKGTRALREILEAGGFGRYETRSDLEDAFLAFVDRHGLPRPEMNRMIQVGDAWITPDAVWPEQRVLVELDSRAWHTGGTSFDDDRARDRAARVAGWTPIRITHRHLHREAAPLARDLHALLQTSRSSSRRTRRKVPA